MASPDDNNPTGGDSADFDWSEFDREAFGADAIQPTGAAATVTPAPTGGPSRKRRLTIAGIAVGTLALVAIVIVALSSGSDPSVSSAAGEMTTTTLAPIVATTTPAPTTTERVTQVATTVRPAPTTTTVPETTTTIAETTTTVAETTTTVAETTTTVPDTTVAPPPASTAPPASTGGGAGGGGNTASPPPADPGTNCTNVGAISIPSLNVLQPILAEKVQFKDGLLCGNHKADKVSEGVDVLPWSHPINESAEGGASMIGQIPSIIFGHRNSHNHPFKLINKLKADDQVIIYNTDGTTLTLKVVALDLMAIGPATDFLTTPSTDGAGVVRLVACSHGDGTPGGVSHRWIATLVKA
jgi:hypothetical protein